MDQAPPIEVEEVEPAPMPPPPTIGEAAFQAACKTLDYRATDENGDLVPILPQPASREDWEMGARAATDAFIRLVPEGDPVAFALSQLWLFNRAMGDQLNVLTTAIAEVRRDTRALVAKMAEYESVLPSPDSLLARAGRWGGTRRQPRAADGG